MPGLNLVFTSGLECPECHVEMAVSGARSHVIDRNGAVVLFDVEHAPKTFHLALKCRNGHYVMPPERSAVEWWFQTPPGAPTGCDAIVLGYRTALYRALRVAAVVARIGWLLWIVAYGLFVLAIDGALRPRSVWIAIGLGLVVLALCVRIPAWRSYYAEALRAGYVRLD